MRRLRGRYRNPDARAGAAPVTPTPEAAIETVLTVENNKELYAPRDDVFNQTCFAVLDCLWENRAEVARRLAFATMAGGMTVLFGGAAYRTLFPARKPRRTRS